MCTGTVGGRFTVASHVLHVLPSCEMTEKCTSAFCKKEVLDEQLCIYFDLEEPTGNSKIGFYWKVFISWNFFSHINCWFWNSSLLYDNISSASSALFAALRIVLVQPQSQQTLSIYIFMISKKAILIYLSVVVRYKGTRNSGKYPVSQSTSSETLLTSVEFYWKWMQTLFHQVVIAFFKPLPHMCSLPGITFARVETLKFSLLFYCACNVY